MAKQSLTKNAVKNPAEDVSERILACARAEFLEKGYSDASLRTIAAGAGVTTGTIYSRFRDKEGLFCALVEPAADGLIEMFVTIQENFHQMDPGQQPARMDGYITDEMLHMLDYVYDHFEAFQLLLDASYGTKFQDFVERLVEIETEYTYKYMEATSFQKEDGEFITEEFIHIMSRAIFESMFEVVRHKMPKEKAVRYLRMLERYHYGGWNAIMEIT